MRDQKKGIPRIESLKVLNYRALKAITLDGHP